MTAHKRALAILEIAIELRDWRKAEEACAILDAAENPMREWDRPKPIELPAMLKAAKVAGAA